MPEMVNYTSQPLFEMDVAIQRLVLLVPKEEAGEVELRDEDEAEGQS